MTYKSSLYFLFNGEKSTDYGVINCSVESGLYEEQFLPSTEIITTKIRDRDEPYYQSIVSSPRVLNIILAFEDNIDSDKLRALGRLFNQNYYCPMSFSDDLNKIYYVIYQGDPSLFHTGIQGYVKFQLLCKSPYVYSNEYLSEVYTITDSGTIEFTNSGDVDLYPEMEIVKVGDGDLSIVNLSNGGYEFEFTGLVDGEILYVNNNDEDILSSLNVNRFGNFNDNYLYFKKYSINRLSVTGSCSIQFRYYFQLLN